MPTLNRTRQAITEDILIICNLSATTQAAWRVEYSGTRSAAIIERHLADAEKKLWLRVREAFSKLYPTAMPDPKSRRSLEEITSTLREEYKVSTSDLLIIRDIWDDFPSWEGSFMSNVQPRKLARETPLREADDSNPFR